MSSESGNIAHFLMNDVDFSDDPPVDFIDGLAINDGASSPDEVEAIDVIVFQSGYETGSLSSRSVSAHLRPSSDLSVWVGKLTVRADSVVSCNRR